MVGRAGLHLRHSGGAKNNEEQKRMKQFLVTYLAPASVIAEWKKTDPAQRREAETKMQAQWKKWMADNAKMLVNVGAGVGKTKLVNTRGTSDTKNDVMLYSVAQAESPTHATRFGIVSNNVSSFAAVSPTFFKCFNAATEVPVSLRCN